MVRSLDWVRHSSRGTGRVSAEEPQELNTRGHERKPGELSLLFQNKWHGPGEGKATMNCGHLLQGVRSSRNKDSRLSWAQTWFLMLSTCHCCGISAIGNPLVHSARCTGSESLPPPLPSPSPSPPPILAFPFHLPPLLPGLYLAPSLGYIRLRESRPVSCSPIHSGVRPFDAGSPFFYYCRKARLLHALVISGACVAIVGQRQVLTEALGTGL